MSYLFHILPIDITDVILLPPTNVVTCHSDYYSSVQCLTLSVALPPVCCLIFAICLYNKQVMASISAWVTMSHQVIETLQAIHRQGHHTLEFWSGTRCVG